jgi:hypothetical protein
MTFFAFFCFAFAHKRVELGVVDRADRFPASPALCLFIYLFVCLFIRLPARSSLSRCSTHRLRHGKAGHMTIDVWLEIASAPAQATVR